MASKAATIRAIRNEWKAGTGEDPGQVAAEVILDQMCDAFFEKYYGAGRAVAVHEMRGIAEYLQWQWTGDDGRGLRSIMEIIDAGHCDCGTTAVCAENAARVRESKKVANDPRRDLVGSKAKAAWAVN